MRIQPLIQTLAPDTEPYAQVLVGTSGSDWIVGTSGDDIITGGGGADALAGGSGRDTFVYLAASDSNASAYDNLYDFQSDEDRIDLTALSPTSVSIVRQGGSSFLFANSASGTLQVVGAGRDFNGSDLILPTGMGVFIDNRGSGATLIGTAANDVIRGGIGQDRIIGGAGADTLMGGTGLDSFGFVSDQDSTPAAFDTILNFSAGFDQIDLTALNVHNVGIVQSPTNGYFTVFATTETGSQFMVRVHGGFSGRDILMGTQGATIISEISSFGRTDGRGTNNADTIYLDGSISNYVLGRGGADLIVLRGSGATTIQVDGISDSSLAAPDTVFGFVSGRDKITVSPGDIWTYGIAYQGTDSFLFIDVGNDGNFDMLIQFNNVFLRSGDINEYTIRGAPIEDGIAMVASTFLDATHPISEGLNQDHSGWLTLL